MIYVIKTKSDPAFIKIGFSKDDPVNRLKAIQTGCPFDLEMLYLKSGSFIHESILHGHLACFLARGEWFHFGEDCHEKLLRLFNEFGFKDVPIQPGTTTPRLKGMASPAIKVKAERIMEVLGTGVTTAEAAKLLGIHKSTVIRHSIAWRKMNRA